jgi:hypothetical protein
MIMIIAAMVSLSGWRRIRISSRSLYRPEDQRLWRTCYARAETHDSRSSSLTNPNIDRDSPIPSSSHAPQKIKDCRVNKLPPRPRHEVGQIHPRVQILSQTTPRCKMFIPCPPPTFFYISCLRVSRRIHS